MSSTALDILAIAAHRDDVEQTCGGTLLKAAQRGQRTGILDLTQGEMGTRGHRRRPRARGGRRSKNSRRGLAAGARHSRRPRRKYLGESTEGGERDPRNSAARGDSALLEGTASGSLHLFRAGIRGLLSGGVGEELEFRNLRRIVRSRSCMLRFTTTCVLRLWWILARSSSGKFASILAYKSQFSDQEAGKDLFPAHDEIRARVDAMARYYGMLGGVTYAEPFLQKEVGLVEDLLAIPVKSI